MSRKYNDVSERIFFIITLVYEYRVFDSHGFLKFDIYIYIYSLGIFSALFYSSRFRVHRRLVLKHSPCRRNKISPPIYAIIMPNTRAESTTSEDRWESMKLSIPGLMTLSVEETLFPSLVGKVSGGSEDNAEEVHAIG